ncbi:MAG: molybdopterin molybdotransferase MoeA [Syntrophales bacterium]|jgi:molybdopterin molybdotransferase|nr:molybdopterin molybdotransferase MoeA [Syntrophales bacterium]MDY0045083.1 molybdopterin molybdotransferase MoeA [Syntrophales bacterium]
MKTVEESLKHILDSAVPLGLEKISILQALGRVAGEDIRSQRSIPPRDNSAMDGYALRSEDIDGASRQNPVAVHTVEHIPAGYFPQKAIGRGEAARIMTGAPVPEGADVVVKIEDVDVEGDLVQIFEPSPAGEHVRARGEDVIDGELIVPRGTVIGPAHIGMLASTGHASIPVYQRPLVAVIATGDELIDIDGDAASGKIVSSNSYSLYGQILQCGGMPMQLGIAKDNINDLLAIFKAAERADIIISSGGVSVGDYDYVKGVVSETGITLEIENVAQRPGKPFAFGTKGRTLFFGLPGNPVSAMMSFEQFVRPVIRKITGHRDLFRKTIRATLEEDIKKKSGLTYFIRGKVTGHEKGFNVATTGDQGSGILKSMVLANGIIVLPRDVTEVKKGEKVTVQLIDDSFLSSPKPEYLPF